MTRPMTEPLFFATEGELWDWYSRKGQSFDEIWIGLYKKSSRIPSISIQQATDAALCFGWSQSKRVTIDSQRFKIRFTPRIPAGAWTPATIRRYKELDAQGLIQPAGRAVWDKRDTAASREYKAQSKGMVLSPEFQKRLKANATAFEFWEAQPEGYHKRAVRWVMRAKKEETREKRFETLLDYSERGKRFERA
jgi:uncharacterized protein YdeI (YjbR/CyaY-like superfamily)